MSFTADDFIKNMISRLGWDGSHVWSFYGLARGTAWCDGEISYTFNKIGARKKWCGGKPSFYVPDAQRWMAANWETVYDYRGKGSLKKVKKGDVVIFMWTRGSRDHIGACRATTGSADTILSIEGNTSGHKVAKRTRKKKYIYAVYRPPYNGSTPEPFMPLDVDGEMGYMTIVRLQQWLGVPQDGEIGPQTTKALQKKIGMTGKQVDGEWGKKTTEKLQRYLTRSGFDVKIDRSCGKETIKALQRFLNSVAKNKEKK